MRILICGGRDFVDDNMLNKALNAIKNKFDIEVLIHGGCSGADELAGQWAKRMGIPHAKFEACWTYYGNGAGPKRNQWMVQIMNPTHVVAFPGGKGTSNMVKLAQEHGAKVWEVGK